MPAAPPDRWLDLDTLLGALCAQQRIRPADAHAWPLGTDEPPHPLERIARRRLDDLQRPGQPLDGPHLGYPLGPEHLLIGQDGRRP